jgi:hypothetical protein
MIYATAPEHGRNDPSPRQPKCPAPAPCVILPPSMDLAIVIFASSRRTTSVGGWRRGYHKTNVESINLACGTQWILSCRMTGNPEVIHLAGKRAICTGGCYSSSRRTSNPSPELAAGFHLSQRNTKQPGFIAPLLDMLFAT